MSEFLKPFNKMNKQKIETLKNEILIAQHVEIEYIPKNCNIRNYSTTEAILIEINWRNSFGGWCEFNIDSSCLNNAIVDPENGTIELKDTDGNLRFFHLFNKVPKKILVDW